MKRVCENCRWNSDWEITRCNDKKNNEKYCFWWEEKKAVVLWGCKE